MSFRRALEQVKAQSLAFSGYLPEGIEVPERDRAVKTGNGGWLQLQEAPHRQGYVPPVTGDYGECVLCNDSAARLHPIIGHELQLGERRYVVHMTPHSLHHAGHFVCSTIDHIPMRIDELAVAELIELALLEEEIVVGMNGDLPFTGSSILGHLHFQLFFDHLAPVIDAKGRKLSDDLGVLVEQLDWPCIALRFSGPPEELAGRVSQVVLRWKDCDPVANTVNLYVYHHFSELFVAATLRDNRLVYVKDQGAIQKSGTAGFLDTVGRIITRPDVFEQLCRLPDNELEEHLSEYLAAHSPEIDPRSLEELVRTCN